MSSFSGAVKLADLNDFIAPSQACVVNLKDLKEKPIPQDVEVTISLCSSGRSSHVNACIILRPHFADGLLNIHGLEISRHHLKTA